jgi:haloalkane dehalogenase
MGMGYSEIQDGQSISPDAQVSMLSDLLNSLHVDAVDLLANDSGGLIAQLFVARYPKRVRTLLLTNCDVDENNPPRTRSCPRECKKSRLHASGCDVAAPNPAA